MKVAEFRQIVKEKDRIISAFTSFSDSKHRATTKVVRRLLLEGPYLLNGRRWDVKPKSLGAGVYELSLKEIQ